MMEYIKKEDVEKMLDDAKLISDGEYCGYCTEDVSINSIETQDVFHVIHAKWIDEDFPEKQATVHGFAVCSSCGELSHKAEHGYNILSKYCPHCGAKMDLTDD